MYTHIRCIFPPPLSPLSLISPHPSPSPAVQWIYGGAWILGDNYEFGLYDATKLAGDHKV